MPEQAPEHRNDDDSCPRTSTRKAARGLPCRFQRRRGRLPGHNPILPPAPRQRFISIGARHVIWDVDPVAKTATVWLDNLTSPQQMTFSEDGQMLFIAMDTSPGDVLGIDATTKTTVFHYATLSTTSPLNQPAGVAIGSGTLERDLFVCCGDGTVWQIDRGDATATLIASGGSHGRAARCSINQGLLLAQTDRIMRRTAPAASGFGYNSPYNFTAVAMGAGQVALYWDGVPEATGYNINRGYNAGGEDYNAPPQNGSTPWTQVSYAGGNNYRFVDGGLVSGAEYFYTVKAAFPEGASTPSEEHSDVPYPGAIPWGDTPQAVLDAIRLLCNDGQVAIADSLRSAGPDGLLYGQDAPLGPSWSSPGGKWLRYTDLYHFQDGSYTIMMDDDPEDSAQIQGT